MSYSQHSTTTTTTSLAILLYTTFLFLLFNTSNAGDSNILMAGETLTAGNSLTAGNYNLVMQDDCNLVVYESSKAIWASRTAGMASNCFLHFQMNGELLILNSNITQTVWRTETGGTFDRFVLVLKPNGNAVVFGQAVWSTGTMKATNNVAGNSIP